MTTVIISANNTAAMKDNLIIALILSPFIFSTFFLACRLFSIYILPRLQEYYRKHKAMKNIDNLIAKSKGKFFSITFEKKDGSIRKINGKNRYDRLIKGTGSPATDALKAKGFKSAVNRNGESWFSFMPEKVIEFKCGQIHETF